MSSLAAYINLARPHHYIKNGFMFVPLFFAHQLMNGPLLINVAKGFAAFCLASSAVYVCNDMVDVEKDRAHATKRFRPLAAGKVSLRGAVCFFGLLLCGSGILAFTWTDPLFVMLMTGYVGLNVLYSLVLQKVVLADVLCVATGFVIRVFAGAALIDVQVSGWLAAMTLLLALLITFAKRRCDLTLIMQDGYDTHYNSRNLAVVVAGLAVITGLSYIVYTLYPSIIAEHQEPRLYFSAVWVVLGIGRYLWIVLRATQDCSPVRMILKDRYLQTCVVCWVGTMWLLIY